MLTGFLGHASLVMDRALRHDNVLKVILAEEASGKSLWDSVSKLHAMVAKSSRFEEISWLFVHMHDAKMCGFLDGELSVRQLTGQGATGGKGLCDLVLFKMRFRDYFLGDFLLLPEAKEMPEKYRQALKDVFSSHETMRAKIGFPNSPDDLSWKSGWTRSADHCLQMIQDIFSLEVAGKKIIFKYFGQNIFQYEHYSSHLSNNFFSIRIQFSARPLTTT